MWAAQRRSRRAGCRRRPTRSARTQPAKAIALEHKSQAKLEKIGVKFVTDVDKSGFIKIAEPIQDKIAKQLGPHAVNILELVRADQ